MPLEAYIASWASVTTRDWQSHVLGLIQHSSFTARTPTGLRLRLLWQPLIYGISINIYIYIYVWNTVCACCSPVRNLKPFARTTTRCQEPCSSPIPFDRRRDGRATAGGCTDQT